MIDIMIIIEELHLSALANLQAFDVHDLKQVIHSNRKSNWQEAASFLFILQA